MVGFLFFEGGLTMKKIIFSILIAFSLIFLTCGPASAIKSTTINVYEGDDITLIIDTLACSGDIIIVHEGEYFQAVTIRKPVTLKGLPGAIIKTPFFYGISLEAPATVTGFIIKPEEDNMDPQHGIMLGSVRGAIIENNDISGFISNGIQDISTSGSLIRNNKITSFLPEDNRYWYVGIAINQSSDTSIVGNVIRINNQINSWGIQIDQCNTPLIKDNKINASGDLVIQYGIALSNSANGVVTGNEVSVDNQARGTELFPIRFSTVINSSITNNVVCGGYRGIGGWGENLVISGNTIYAHEVNGSVGGIHVQSEATNTTVKNNFVYGDFWEGILVTEPSTANTISNNTITITGDGWVGIELRLGAFSNIVKNNTISGIRPDFAEINDTEGLNIIKY